MAKVTAPLNSAEARGVVGDLVYNTWRGIATVRARVTPKHEFTAPRVAMQDLMTSIAGDWAALDQHTRDEWHAYAARHVEPDWTGQDIRLPAWNWWIRVQIRRSLDGLYASNLPPREESTIDLQNLAIVTDMSLLYLTWDLTAHPHYEDYFVEVWATPVHSAGRNPTIHDTKRIGCTYLTETALEIPCTIPGYYTAFARPVHQWGAAGNWLRCTGYYTG
jgi:hypothetical protein